MRSYADITPEQDSAVDRLYEGNTLLIAQKGFGKAVVAQTAAQELIEAGALDRVLILAPLKVCQLTWATEHEKWSHLWPVVLACGDEKTRIAAMGGKCPIVVMNFENLAWAAEQGYLAQFSGLIVDECSKLKAAGGGRFRALRKNLKNFGWRVAMSADPIAEVGTDIYTQAMIVDAGAALGRNKERFMRRFFYPTDFSQRNWTILPGQGEVLAKALAPILYVADGDAYEASLPEIRDEVVHVRLPGPAMQAYAEMESSGCVVVEGVELEAPNEAVVTGKLLQITAGALYLPDGSYARLHDVKMLALLERLDAATGPVAVAYWYKFELDLLKQQVPGLVVLGEDAVVAERRWNGGRVPVMAVHPSSCGHGLNLQYGGHELMVLTAPWGADPWEQLIGRFRRRGQRSPYVRRTVFVVPGTVDELIMDRHLTKAYDSEALNAKFAEI